MTTSAVLERKLSTGDAILFNKTTRELIVIGSANAGGKPTWEGAVALAKGGKAHLFDKRSLQAITEALQHVVLLGP